MHLYAFVLIVSLACTTKPSRRSFFLPFHEREGSIECAAEHVAFFFPKGKNLGPNVDDVIPTPMPEAHIRRVNYGTSILNNGSLTSLVVIA